MAIATSFKRALEPEHEVEVTDDPADAARWIRAGKRYDVIVCDLMMPRITGMDLHAELALCAPDQADRMLFISGGASTARTRAFLAQTGKPCLEKPIELALLRAIVNQQLRASG